MRRGGAGAPEPAPVAGRRPAWRACTGVRALLVADAGEVVAAEETGIVVASSPSFQATSYAGALVRRSTPLLHSEHGAKMPTQYSSYRFSIPHHARNPADAPPTRGNVPSPREHGCSMLAILQPVDAIETMSYYSVPQGAAPGSPRLGLRDRAGRVEPAGRAEPSRGAFQYGERAGTCGPFGPIRMKLMAFRVFMGEAARCDGLG